MITGDMPVFPGLSKDVYSSIIARSILFKMDNKTKLTEEDLYSRVFDYLSKEDDFKKRGDFLMDIFANPTSDMEKVNKTLKMLRNEENKEIAKDILKMLSLDAAENAAEETGGFIGEKVGKFILDNFFN